MDAEKNLNFLPIAFLLIFIVFFFGCFHTSGEEINFQDARCQAMNKTFAYLGRDSICIDWEKYKALPPLYPLTYKNIHSEFVFHTITGVLFYPSINSYGFRGGEWAKEKAQNKSRIVVLGDSFAFGEGLDDNQTWPFLLEKYLNKGVNRGSFEVLNFGYQGSSTTEELRIFEQEASVFSPDFVILSYTPGDYTPAVLHRNLIHFLFNEENLGSRASNLQKIYLPKISEVLEEEVPLIELMRLYVFKPILTLANQTGKERLLILIFPCGGEEIHFLESFLIENSFNYIKLSDYGINYEDEYILSPDDLHPSAYACEKTSEILGRVVGDLLEDGLN